MENKKRLFVLVMFFVVSIFLISMISSVEFTIHENYDQKETLISKISGNFEESLSEEDIVFYKYYDGAEEYTVINFELLNIEGDYYIYAQLDKSEGNYSVKIEDVDHYSGGELTDETIRRNFTISDKTADFSVDPGVIKTETDFNIELTNLRSESITVYINPEDDSSGFFSFSESSSDSERQINLDPGEVREVDFESGNKTGLKNITMSSNTTNYDVPVYSIVKNETDSETQNETTNETNQTNDTLIKYFSEERIERTIVSGNKVQEKITITNSEDKDMKNISLKLSSNLENYVNLTENFISSLESGNSTDIGLIVLSEEPRTVEGNLTLNSISYDEETNYSSLMDLSLSFTNETTSVQNDTTNETNQTGPAFSKTCSEEGGQKCNESSVCEGQQIQAQDGECCLGECKLKEEDNTGKTVGWVIVIVVVLFLVWFYLVRYKGIKSKINILEKAKGKKKNKS